MGRLCSAARHRALHTEREEEGGGEGREGHAAASQRVQSISAMYSPGRCTPPLQVKPGILLFFLSFFPPFTSHLCKHDERFDSFQYRTAIKRGSCTRNRSRQYVPRNCFPTTTTVHNCHHISPTSPPPPPVGRLEPHQVTTFLKERGKEDDDPFFFIIRSLGGCVHLPRLHLRLKKDPFHERRPISKQSPESC